MEKFELSHDLSSDSGAFHTNVGVGVFFLMFFFFFLGDVTPSILALLFHFRYQLLLALYREKVGGVVSQTVVTAREQRAQKARQRIKRSVRCSLSTARSSTPAKISTFSRGSVDVSIRTWPADWHCVGLRNTASATLPSSSVRTVVDLCLHINSEVINRP